MVLIRALFPSRRRPGVGFSVATAAACLLATGPAAATEKLEAKYAATLAGMRVGSGSMTLDISRGEYTMTGAAKTEGMMRLIENGSGDVSVRGTIQGTKLSPTRYVHTVRSRKLQEVAMALAGNAVKQLAVEPPVEVKPDRVPLSEANKRGVLDPLSAGIIPAAGANGTGPEACKHKAPVFDGRLRYDLTLSYKRHENVRTDGYQGQVLVCRVSFTPIGGHEKERFAIKYLRENRDMEIWFAPVAGTRFLVFYRISVPTPVGTAVLQATRFVATGTPTRTGAVPASRAQ
jgi:hypothetical protein